MTYNDITEKEFQHFRLIRNRAGEYLAKGQFALSFEAILDMKRDVKRRKLHPQTFDNLLSEVIAIGNELNGDSVILIDFSQYVSRNIDRFNKV
jgi:hypothetical protein